MAFALAFCSLSTLVVFSAVNCAPYNRSRSIDQVKNLHVIHIYASIFVLILIYDSHRLWLIDWTIGTGANEAERWNMGSWKPDRSLFACRWQIRRFSQRTRLQVFNAILKFFVFFLPCVYARTLPSVRSHVFYDSLRCIDRFTLRWLLFSS